MQIFYADFYCFLNYKKKFYQSQTNIYQFYLNMIEILIKFY